jgi:predicted O-methyltransferase YrrM
MWNNTVIINKYQQVKSDSFILIIIDSYKSNMVSIIKRILSMLSKQGIAIWYQNK